jgi:hypothetical protein
MLLFDDLQLQLLTVIKQIINKSRESHVQSDWIVKRPILKYLLMVEIQYSSIVLIITQYPCDYARVKTGQVML